MQCTHYFQEYVMRRELLNVNTCFVILHVHWCWFTVLGIDHFNNSNSFCSKLKPVEAKSSGEGRYRGQGRFADTNRRGSREPDRYFFGSTVWVSVSDRWSRAVNCVWECEWTLLTLSRPVCLLHAYTMYTSLQLTPMVNQRPVFVEHFTMWQLNVECSRMQWLNVEHSRM